MRQEFGKLAVAFLLGVVILAACNTNRTEIRQETALPTPMVPPELQNLPVDLRIDCIYESAVALWELPGLNPVDPDSSSGANRGDPMGRVKACAEVRVTDYAWSETDNVFYVFVEAGEQKGWLKINFLDFGR